MSWNAPVPRRVPGHVIHIDVPRRPTTSVRRRSVTREGDAHPGAAGRRHAASIVPPCASTSRFAMASPRPAAAGVGRADEPVEDRGPAGPARSPVRCPRPRGATPWPPSSPTRTVTVPPPGVWRIAFDSRLLEHLGDADRVGLDRPHVVPIQRERHAARRGDVLERTRSHPRRARRRPWARGAARARPRRPSTASAGPRGAAPSRSVSSSTACSAVDARPDRGRRACPRPSPRITCSGVRSSWAMSASSSRRRRSFVSRRAVISLNAPVIRPAVRTPGSTRAA